MEYREIGTAEDMTDQEEQRIREDLGNPSRRKRLTVSRRDAQRLLSLLDRERELRKAWADEAFHRQDQVAELVYALEEYDNNFGTFPAHPDTKAKARATIAKTRA